MYMNNLKVVVTLFVLVAVIVIGLFVAFKTKSTVDYDLPYIVEEPIETPVPIYSSNGGEK